MKTARGDDLIREHWRRIRRQDFYVRDGGDPAGRVFCTVCAEYGITYRTPVLRFTGRPLWKTVGRAFSDGKEYCALVREVRRAGGDFIKIMTTGILDFATKACDQ